MRALVLPLIALAACGTDGEAFEDELPGNVSPDAGTAPDAAPEPDAGPEEAPVLFHIELDYRFDDAGFFDDPERRYVLEQAAARWGQIFVGGYPSVPAGTPLRSRDPEQPGEPSATFSLEIDIDDLIVFVGCSTIDGPSGTTAMANHAAAINTVPNGALREELRQRYEGPIFQPWTGWISFDCDEPWFFDQTLDTEDDIPGSQSDFWSVAMHELGHVLGFGTSEVFFTLRKTDPMRLVGPAAMAAHGDEVPLNTSGLHLNSSLISDGRSTLLDPSRPGGTRTPPTSLDIAVLSDLGHEPAAK